MKLFRPREGHFNTLSSLIAEPDRLAALHADTTLPADIGKWLGRLKLLYGVPLNYLVPEESMLPAESIRFFQVDLNWIYSLIEGAYSIGRSTTGDAAHDTLFTRRVHTVSHVAARHIRAARLPVRALLRSEVVEYDIIRSAGFDVELVEDTVTEREVGRYELERIALDEASMTADQLATTVTGEQITGFLLRSAVVEGWPGLEVIAYDAGGFQLTNVLRMDHLSPSILLYMVEGVIDHIDIKEPAEGLHFGVDLASGDCGERSLRYVTVPATAPPNTNPGDEITGATAGAVPCRPGRTLKIAQLAANIQAALQTAQANQDASGNPAPFTSAEFALEMVEGVQEVRFREGMRDEG
jgi:hypothetical protein